MQQLQKIEASACFRNFLVAQDPLDEPHGNSNEQIVILGMRTIRWEATHSDGLASTEWEKEVEHSKRVAKRVLTFLTTRYPDLFQSTKVPWYVATDEDSPK